MNFPWIQAIACTLLCAMVSTQISANTGSDVAWSEHTTVAIEQRVSDLQLPFEARYTPDVERYIQRYITNGYKDAQAMLGRADLYFPIFKHYLVKENLPLDLMYLPVVESNLNAAAQSGVGASGLWQFMPTTATQYGLTVNEYVDERNDPYRATAAAVDMLERLYLQFGDWSLALAAYNCGPGRVKRAMRQAGSNDFWTIKPFLPKQTQHYIPAFIAAAYVANYYADHGLRPRQLNNELQDMRAVKVFEYMTFSDVASITGVSYSNIKRYNSAFVKDIVPKTSNGNYLLLPKHAAKVLRQYLNDKRRTKWADSNALPVGKVQSTYVIQTGETIRQLADNFRCSVEELMEWNNLGNREVVYNEEIRVFLPIDLVRP